MSVQTQETARKEPKTNDANTVEIQDLSELQLTLVGGGNVIITLG